MGNVLEDVTIPLYPVIDSIKKQMLKNGAIGAMMSGSGSLLCSEFFRMNSTAIEMSGCIKGTGRGTSGIYY